MMSLVNNILVFIASSLSITAVSDGIKIPTAPSYIFSHGTKICSYDVTTPGMLNTEIEPNCFWQIPTTSPIVLGMILSKNTILVATDSTIYQFGLNAKRSFLDKVLLHNAGIISAMAVDWISGNIYYVDKQSSSIRVIDLHGRHLMTILENIQGVNGITVDPIGRNLFWTMRGSSSNSGIGRSKLDGSERNDSFYQHANSKPFYICMDHNDKTLYWSDHDQGTLESLSLTNGTYREIIRERSNYPYTVAVNKDLVVWSQNVPLWEIEGHNLTIAGIYWTRKASGTHAKFKHHFALADIGDIILYGNYAQPTGYSSACGSNAACSQLCFPISETERRCMCSVGYTLEDNGRSCKPVFPWNGFGQNIIVISDSSRGEIFAMDTVTQKISAFKFPKQRDIANGAVDLKNNSIFWSNAVDGTIMKSNLGATTFSKVLVQPEHQIVSLTIDPDDQTIFYSDLRTGQVASVSYSGRNNQVILNQNNTWSIVADYNKKHLYMAVWTAVSKLIRTDYNGKNNVTLVDDFLEKPRGLSIDWKSNIMYWCDTYKVEKARIDGTDRDTLYITDNTMALMSTGVSGDYLYIADWGNTNQLKRIQRHTFDKIEVFGKKHFLHTTGIFAIPIIYDLQSTTTTTLSVVITSKGTSTEESPVSASSTGSTGNSKKNLIIGAIVGVVGLGIMIIIVLVAVIVIRRRRKAPATVSKNENDNAFENPGYSSAAELGLPPLPPLRVTDSDGMTDEPASASAAPPLPMKRPLEKLKPGEEFYVA